MQSSSVAIATDDSQPKSAGYQRDKTRPRPATFQGSAGLPGRGRAARRPAPGPLCRPIMPATRQCNSAAGAAAVRE